MCMARVFLVGEVLDGGGVVVVVVVVVVTGDVFPAVLAFRMRWAD